MALRGEKGDYALLAQPVQGEAVPADFPVDGDILFGDFTSPGIGGRGAGRGR